ncbi:GTPase family protein [Gallibacterium anatis]|uniref:GTPase family protein n=1 Tax=Gallibacterium anatis TaxID=750 RepID=UPI0039FCF27E
MLNFNQNSNFEHKVEETILGDEFVKHIPKKLRDTLVKSVLSSIAYTPRIGIMGQSGAGKSSLVNAIVGRKVFDVGHAGGCTRKVQEKTIEISRANKLTFVDLPGIAENEHYDKEYQDLYEKELKSLDIVLWIIKIDNRANQADQLFYNKMINDFKYPKNQIVFVLSQIDKTNPSREFNYKLYIPSQKQKTNIEANIQRIADDFSLSENNIFPVVCDYVEDKDIFETYGLDDLTTKIITSMPNKAKSGFYASVDKKNRTETAKQEAKKGFEDSTIDTIFDTIEQTAGFLENIPGIGQFATVTKKVVSNIARPIAKAIGKLWDSIFS